MRVRTEQELAAMSAGKLKAYTEYWDQQSGQACKALIAAGRGQERGSETREKAANPHDTLAGFWARCSDAAMAAHDELRARRRYHGKDHPIRKPAWLRF